MPSTVPAAIAALVTLCQTAVTDADVYDGPPTGGDYLDWVGVGYDPSGGDAVTVSTDWASLGTQRHEENYDITCTLGSASGDAVMTTRRARAYALLDAVAAGIAADYTLGGSVRIAHVTGHSLLQDLDEQGLTAGIRFTVNVAARIGT